MKNKNIIDYWVFIMVLGLLFIGIIMVFSASSAYSYIHYDDSYFFMKGQIKSSLVGIVIMIFLLKFDYKKLGNLSPIFLLCSFILLILVRIPGIGQENKNTWRWIFIGGFQFQPSEIVKISIILFFAFSLSKRCKKMDSFSKGLLPYLIIISCISFLLLLQPHLSCTLIILFVSTIMLISAGAKIRHFMMLIVPSVCIFSIIIYKVDYMGKRVLSFLDPFKYADESGYQVIQSLYAIASGGTFGRGFGKSVQKLLYIPEPHNDFIFSIIAEELGFLGIVGLIGMFVILIWRGIKISMNAPDSFGKLTALGITSLIAVQVILNIAVVTSSMPPTGVTLPFISAGGTSIILFLSSVGILLNISKQSNYKHI
ncbi:MAG: putative lipid II flippase FtsW [Clostridiales bacterium]